MGKQIYSSENKQIQKNLDRFKNKDIKEWVSKWVSEKQANEFTNRYILTKIYVYLKVLEPLKIPVKEVIDRNNKEEIKRLINKIKKNNNGSIPRTYKTDLKVFFRWVNEGETPKCVKWVNTKISLKDQKADSPLLTDLERKAIIDNAPT
ncbi:hypothetical protein HN865_02800, partial [Candidatus Woesearchaeota archaeon]|nr:hypothetical protein [Candidatus Woesearchaeota archaeon]